MTSNRVKSDVFRPYILNAAISNHEKWILRPIYPLYRGFGNPQTYFYSKKVEKHDFFFKYLTEFFSEKHMYFLVFSTYMSFK